MFCWLYNDNKKTLEFAKANNPCRPCLFLLVDLKLHLCGFFFPFLLIWRFTHAEEKEICFIEFFQGNLNFWCVTFYLE